MISIVNLIDKQTDKQIGIVELAWDVTIHKNGTKINALELELDYLEAYRPDEDDFSDGGANFDYLESEDFWNAISGFEKHTILLEPGEQIPSTCEEVLINDGKFEFFFV